MLQVFNQQHSPFCKVCFGSSHHISSWKVVLVGNFPLMVSDDYWRRGYNLSVSQDSSQLWYTFPLPPHQSYPVWISWPLEARCQFQLFTQAFLRLWVKFVLRMNSSIKGLGFGCGWSLLVQTIQLCLHSECVCSDVEKRENGIYVFF